MLTVSAIIYGFSAVFLDGEKTLSRELEEIIIWGFGCSVLLKIVWVLILTVYKYEDYAYNEMFS